MERQKDIFSLFYFWYTWRARWAGKKTDEESHNSWESKKAGLVKPFTTASEPSH